MKKNKLIGFLVISLLFTGILLWTHKKALEEECAKIITKDIHQIVDALCTVVLIEENNAMLGVEFPNSLEEQKDTYMTLMKYLSKKYKNWDEARLISENVCSLLYIDSFFGEKYHEYLVEKLWLYVNEEGVLSFYPKQTNNIQEKDIFESVQNTAYNLYFLSKALSSEEINEFGFIKALVHYFNMYLPEASQLDGDQQKERVHSMRRMYSEILCSTCILGIEEELNFKPIQNLQQQKSRRNFEERYAENSLYNAASWAMVAMEERLYNQSAKYDSYANQMFCQLQSEADFYDKTAENPLMELRFYILSNGDLAGNDFYRNSVNVWLDEVINKISISEQN